MKYKLLKDTPSHKKGTICRVFTKGGGSTKKYLYPMGEYQHIATLEQVTDEWFAPYLFKTEDRVDIYKGETCVILDTSTNYIYLRENYSDVGLGNNNEYKRFSTKEAAQKWIEEQNKPKFEKSEWLYCEDKFGKEFEMLFRYSKSEKSTLIQGMDIFGTECYTIWNAAHGNKIEIDKEELNCCFEQECDKATPEQILDILSKVAIHKGFKEGVKYKSALTGNSFIVSSINFEWDGEGLSTVNKRFNGFIYKDGEWAEIVEDVPEYVECIKEDVSLKPGNIYKVKSQNSWHGILNDIYYIEGLVAPYYCKNFKASTKEAYDAQFQTKEMTITLNGDVVNTSHWGNNVKITYK